VPIANAARQELSAALFIIQNANALSANVVPTANALEPYVELQNAQAVIQGAKPTQNANVAIAFVDHHANVMELSAIRTNVQAAKLETRQILCVSVPIAHVGLIAHVMVPNVILLNARVAIHAQNPRKPRQQEAMKRSKRWEHQQKDAPTVVIPAIAAQCAHAHKKRVNAHAVVTVSVVKTVNVKIVELNQRRTAAAMLKQMKFP
jgi:hypothetical protein